MTLTAGLLPFSHEPYSNFAQPEVARRQREAFAEVRRLYGGRSFPLIIGGERLDLPQTFPVCNPARPQEVLWSFPLAGRGQLDGAVEAARKAFETWRFSEPLQRASILKRAAQLLRARRLEFNAVMTLENGKNWAEADGEVAESVDHFEVFAREALRWSEPKAVEPMPEEHVTMVYEPIGVVAVISPWNFPSAIPLGMALGAIAAGNTVVMKPASEAPLSAWLLAELLEEAGLPPGVLNLITGADEEMGDPLVDHPGVRMIAFTGSKEIGCRVFERAAKVQPGQIWLKRVIAEMGGKDATVVCADADLDAAARGIVQAAFGYAGQKCSACSRAIVEDGVYDEVLARAVELTRALSVGPGEDNRDVGPVIHRASGERLVRAIEEGQAQARLVLGGTALPDLPGAFIEPTIFADVPAHSRLFREELFGPVLAFTRARDWEHALELANDSEYGLTGSFYSRDPRKLSEARQRFHVGNLYLNRKCTGALSGTHAFGGYHMSGTGAKVGGPDYLFSFLQAKTIAQKY